MKIAFLTESYPPSIGGQEIRFAELAETLLVHGHSVTVFCVGHSRRLSPRDNLNGVDVHRYPLTDHYKRAYGTPLRRNPFVLLRYALWCRRMARSGGFDAFLFNEWPLVHLMFASRETRAASLVDWCEVRGGRLFQLLQTVLPRMAAGNIAVSPAVAAHIGASSGCQVSYIPSAIRADRYKYLDPAERQGLLCFGRVSPHKNVSFLVSAFKTMRQQGYAGRLTIAGGGPSLGQIRDEVRKAGLEQSVDVLGFVSDEAKIELLARARVMVVPSKREGFPRVVAEAMASGLPVVTVDYPENGTSYIVRHYGVGLVAGPNKADLIRTVQEVESDWAKYSKAGLSAKPSLDWSVVVRKFVQVVEAVRKTAAVEGNQTVWQKQS